MWDILVNKGLDKLQLLIIIIMEHNLLLLFMMGLILKHFKDYKKDSWENRCSNLFNW